MSKFTCFECGFTDDNYYQVCPSCKKSSFQPIVSITNGLLVKYISEKKGRGVFASKKFKYGDLIESCPVLIIPKSEAKDLTKSEVWNYMFPWNSYATTMEDRAIAMGYGMLYNHHHDPNAAYKFNVSRQLPSIEFYAQKDIEVGDEITIYYGDILWFPYSEKDNDNAQKIG